MKLSRNLKHFIYFLKTRKTVDRVARKTRDVLNKSVRWHQSFKNHDSIYNEDLQRIFNIHLYAAISACDLAILQKDLVVCRDQNKRNLFARTASLIVYEVLCDIDKLLLKENRLVIEGYSKEQLAKLDVVTKKLHTYKKAHAKYFKQIRIQTIGHRDIDADVQIKAIEDIDVNQLTALIIEFFDYVFDYLGWSAYFFYEVVKKNKS